LFGYALAFSIAYLMLGAGTGSLILFASVQIGMLAWAIVKRDRPGLLEWLGFGIAFAALVFLVAPGLVGATTARHGIDGCREAVLGDVFLAG
jgi:drug/metabolite transporter (DMT)-like permease